MQYKTILRLLGVLLIIFSQSMLTPLIVNFAFKETVWVPFIAAYALTLLVGFSLWISFKNNKNELKIREGFILVVMFWLTLCIFASLPFVFAVDNLHCITDAIFETVSGITTTGASVIPNIDSLPHAILYYRQQLQFIGGIGIVILAVAILPMLGVGGMQLFRTEIPGPMKDSKLTPRITQSAKVIWSIYLLLTMLCIGCYYLFGMNLFDAIGEALSTVSTGGFSVHSENFAYYKSDALRFICCIFMILGGTNFALHFVALKKVSLKGYWQDEEFRLYFKIILIVALLIFCGLATFSLNDINFHLFVTSLFTTVSLVTTSGFDIEHVSLWKIYIPFLGMILMLIGGCAASTGGGIKMLRALLIYKQSKRELLRLLHPNAIIPIKLGKNVVPDATLQSVWGFITAFIALYLILILVFMFLGNSLGQSLSAISGTISNSGYGIGYLNPDFLNISLPSKWVLIFSMLIGRLEIFSILIMFTRQFWMK